MKRKSIIVLLSLLLASCMNTERKLNKLGSSFSSKDKQKTQDNEKEVTIFDNNDSFDKEQDDNNTDGHNNDGVTQEKKPTYFNTTFISSDTSYRNQFAREMQNDGKRILISSAADSSTLPNAGSVNIYSFNAQDSKWEDIKIQPAQPIEESFFGIEASIMDDIAVIGTYRKNASGLAYIFEFNESSRKWEETKLQNPDGPMIDDDFGDAVYVYGKTVFIGAPGVDSNKGKIFIFTKDETSKIWKHSSSIVASNREEGDMFGSSLKADEDILMTNATGKKNHEQEGQADGALYIYKKINNTNQWDETFIPASPDSSLFFPFSYNFFNNQLIYSSLSNDGKMKVELFNFSKTPGENELTKTQTFRLENEDNYQYYDHYFGAYLDIKENELIIGTLFDNYQNYNSETGETTYHPLGFYVYEYNSQNNVWNKRFHKKDDADEKTGDWTGYAKSAQFFKDHVLVYQDNAWLFTEEPGVAHFIVDY